MPFTNHLYDPISKLRNPQKTNKYVNAARSCTLNNRHPTHSQRQPCIPQSTSFAIGP